MTTAAALDSGVATMDSLFSCNGSIFVDGDQIKCWRSYNPHGTQTLTEAVMNSCNPVFVTLALRMGRDTFYDYLVDLFKDADMVENKTTTKIIDGDAETDALYESIFGIF